MKMLICTTCAAFTSLDDDELGEDNRHDGHSTVTVVGPPHALRLKAARMGVHQSMAGVHRDGSLS